MKRPTDPRPKAASLLPLLPVGAAAAAAGCSGGGTPPAAVPAPSLATAAPSVSSHATVTAMLSIEIPARGAQAATARGRRPLYVSQGTQGAGVVIGTTGATASPTQYFSIPSPGPQPTTVTLPVAAPIGNDTISVTLYDGLPGPAASPNVLSIGSTTATVSIGAKEFDVQALGVAQGVIFRNGSSATFSALQNHGVSQTATLSAIPIDADGYAITGKLAYPVPLTAPQGVTVQPSTLTMSGTNVGLTYAAQQSSTGGTVTAGLPLDKAANSTDNLLVNAYQYLFVATDGANSAGLVTVIDPLDRTIVATIPESRSGPYGIAAVAGCTTGESVVLASQGGLATTTAISVPVPSSSSAPSATDLTALIVPRSSNTAGMSSGRAPSYLASDPNCGVYSANDATLTRYSNFPTATGAAIPSVGWAANSSVAYQGGTIYGIAIVTDAPNENFQAQLQSVPVGGGSVTNVGTVFSGDYDPNEGYGVWDLGMEVGGTSVYEVNDACEHGYYSVMTIPELASTATLDGSTSFDDFAVGPDGTVYYASASAGGDRFSSRGRRSAADLAIRRSAGAERQFSEATPPPQNAPLAVVAGNAVAVSADGRFVAVATGGSAPAVQLYAPPASPGGAPIAAGSPIPLSTAFPTVSRAVFPR